MHEHNSSSGVEVLFTSYFIGLNTTVLHREKSIN